MATYLLGCVQVQQLGNTVTKSIEALPNFDSKHLSAIETLFLAGLSSRHKSIANQSINLWNHTFGASTDMEYSESLRKKLSRLNRHADIAMQKSNIEEDLEVGVAMSELRMVFTDCFVVCLKFDQLYRNSRLFR